MCDDLGTRAIFRFLHRRLIVEASIQLTEFGRCYEASGAIAHVVGDFMGRRGGCHPIDELFSNFVSAGVPPVTVLRIVHQSSQVWARLSEPFIFDCLGCIIAPCSSTCGAREVWQPLPTYPA